MKSHKMSVFRIFPVFFLLISCNGKQSDLYHEMTKIDVHVHIRTENTEIMDLAEAEGFKLLTLNTKSHSQVYIDSQMVFAKAMKEKYPEKISYITTFSMENFEDPDWADDVILKLKKDFEEGAIGVKIWKDIGMTFRDSMGNFVFIDDPMFDPIIDFIIENDKTVVAHIGEPKNCWLPLDSMTVNNNKRYYESHPEYHMYLHPDYPSYEKLIESRDNLLAKNPDLRFVGAHLGSLEWSVDELALRLDKYPNLAVDMSARVGDLQFQEREKVKAFVIKYQDRLLYGTDIGITVEDNIESRLASYENRWKSDWKYFSTNETMTSRNFDKPFNGLELDEDILRKIYFSNAMKWYPEAFN
ncbi:MAG: amidohydrolase family protein [Bacteroidales bacterium]|nr:amidohydrolase family protein [Bacteroidales bacterium]